MFCLRHSLLGPILICYALHDGLFCRESLQNYRHKQRNCFSKGILLPKFKKKKHYILDLLVSAKGSMVFMLVYFREGLLVKMPVLGSISIFLSSSCKGTLPFFTGTGFGLGSTGFLSAATLIDLILRVSDLDVGLTGKSFWEEVLGLGARGIVFGFENFINFGL